MSCFRFIRCHSIAHIQPVWDIRQDRRIARIFSKIWNVGETDLLTSFDGISCYLPPEQTNRGWYIGNDWMRTDQSPQKVGLHCIQGMLNLYPVERGDATLTVMEGSHLYHDLFFDDIKYNQPNDWYRLKDGEKKYFENIGCAQYCVEAPVGSLILWDSRTFHQGIEAQKGRHRANHRMVVYCCMMPKNRYNAKDLIICG